MSSIPRAVRERYKPDRRCSSHGWEFLAPMGAGMLAWKSDLTPALNPQAERRVSPLCGVCSRRWWLALKVVAEAAGQKIGPLLPPGFREQECSLFPSMHQVEGMLGTEETKPGGGRASCMPCYPPQLSHMRPQVSLGWSLKSLSRGSCSASRVQNQGQHPMSVPSNS